MNSKHAEQSLPPNRSRKLLKSTWAEIRTAHASGIGLREIARCMGIPAGTVLARAKREGWTQSVRDAKALAVLPDAPALSVANAVAVTMQERGLRHVERVAGIVERTLPSLEAMAPNALLDRVEDFDRLDKIARRTYGLKDEDASARTVVNIALLGMPPDAVRFDDQTPPSK